MVLYANKTVIVPTKTTTKNSDGVVICGYDYLTNPVTFRADVQPLALTEAQVQIYGIDVKRAKNKKIFYEENCLSIGNRCKIDDDEYLCKEVNEWRNHFEAMLIYCENE